MVSTALAEAAIVYVGEAEGFHILVSGYVGLPDISPPTDPNLCFSCPLLPTHTHTSQAAYLLICLSLSAIPFTSSVDDSFFSPATGPFT